MFCIKRTLTHPLDQLSALRLHQLRQVARQRHRRHRLPRRAVELVGGPRGQVHQAPQPVLRPNRHLRGLGLRVRAQCGGSFTQSCTNGCLAGAQRDLLADA